MAKFPLKSATPKWSQWGTNKNLNASKIKNPHQALDEGFHL